MTLCLRSVSLVLDPGVWCAAAALSLVVELLLVLGSLYMTSSSCLCPGDLLRQVSSYFACLGSVRLTKSSSASPY